MGRHAGDAVLFFLFVYLSFRYPRIFKQNRPGVWVFMVVVFTLVESTAGKHWRCVQQEQRKKNGIKTFKMEVGFGKARHAAAKLKLCQNVQIGFVLVCNFSCSRPQQGITWCGVSISRLPPMGSLECFILGMATSHPLVEIDMKLSCRYFL